MITDSITNTPFDIHGFRYVKYSESLRVDTVISDIAEISAMLQETESASEDDINSIVNLLKIQPARIDKVHLNQHESVLFELIKNLDSKISNIAIPNRKTSFLTFDSNEQRKEGFQTGIGLTTGMTFEAVSNKFPNLVHTVLFRDGNETIGRYLGKNEQGKLVFVNGDNYTEVLDNAAYRLTIKSK